MALNLIGALMMLAGLVFEGGFYWLLTLAFVVGGISNPLYSLYIAYTNDFLEVEDMAAASGGLIFVNGIGAILGPVILGWMMDRWGPYSFFGFLAVMLGVAAIYATYRMTRRAAPPSSESSSFAAMSPSSSPVAIEVAQSAAHDIDNAGKAQQSPHY